ncbi:response regulator [Methylobacterium sp. 1030]|uniref:response regulator n=1 Tax=Methylobacterium sp. 1030 TaxID=3156404 RepID=UPI003399CBC4
MDHPLPPARPVVLVVEDEPLQRMDAVDLVEGLGFEAVEATSAADAVLILTNRPDIRVVLTDIDMPNGYDGMKLAATIRDRWPPIEIIIVSGRRMPRPEEMPKRGVFFAKPYKRREVEATLRRLTP